MNKVEKIRAEIERLLKENRERSSREGYAAVEQLRKVLAFIDSLQDQCNGCNNVKGCINCEDGSEWAHYQLTSVESKEIEL